MPANREKKRTPLGWEARLRIVVGAARGITHILTKYNGRLNRFVPLTAESNKEPADAF